MQPDEAERLKTQFPGPLSGEQRRWVEDLRSMLNVVLDNNLSIRLVWDTFGHDYEEIAAPASISTKPWLRASGRRAEIFPRRGD